MMMVITTATVVTAAAAMHPRTTTAMHAATMPAAMPVLHLLQRQHALDGQ